MPYSKILFPDYQSSHRVRNGGDRLQRQIYDIIRNKWVALTPEEWVRQNVLQYLIEHRGYPKSLIVSEASIEINGMSKRCDAIVYDKDAQPLLIIEFKAKTVPLSQTVFDQISVYNMKLNVPYLFVSNGIHHVFCKVDKDNNQLLYSDTIPSYSDL